MLQVVIDHSTKKADRIWASQEMTRVKDVTKWGKQNPDKNYHLDRMSSIDETYPIPRSLYAAGKMSEATESAFRSGATIGDMAKLEFVYTPKNRKNPASKMTVTQRAELITNIMGHLRFRASEEKKRFAGDEVWLHLVFKSDKELREIASLSGVYGHRVASKKHEDASKAYKEKTLRDIYNSDR